MQIKLSDHFTYGRLLRYTLPTIVMIIFTSLYSVVDGLFVSNLVGDLALSAVNIAFPITMIIGAFGFMLGTGGSAIVARTLGEGKPELASRYFTLFIWCVAGLGVVLSIVTIAFIEPIMRFAGASDLLLEDCIAYGRILLAGSAVFMLQSAFQSFFSVAEKPKLGLLLSLAAGATNITFDYVFIALLGMGVTGAAWATVLGYCVGGVIPVVYFLLPRREGLRLGRTNFYGRELLHACINGSSELMSNISASVVGILYNIRLMDLLGEPGVAAHSVMMYVDFVFVAAFLGFSMGSAPIVSYHYGAENYDELKNIFRRSGVIIAATSVRGVLSGLAGADHPRLPDLCPVLPLLRAEYLRIRLLHGPVQRRPVGPDRLHPHAAAAGWTGAGDAGVLRRGWRLVVRGGGGTAGADAAALPLRLTGENADMLQDGGSAQVVCWLVPTGGKNHETSGADRPI